MKDVFKHSSALFLGWIFVVGGILGLFIPILPGLVLLVAGVVMLNNESALVGKAIEALRAHSTIADSIFKRIFDLSKGWKGRLPSSVADSGAHTRE